MIVSLLFVWIREWNLLKERVGPGAGRGAHGACNRRWFKV